MARKHDVHDDGAYASYYYSIPMRKMQNVQVLTMVPVALWYQVHCDASQERPFLLTANFFCL